MNIGLTFDLKSDAPLDPRLPDDHQEEFDSPVTVDAIAGVLRKQGHEVTLLGDGKPMVEKVLANPPDFVFNFAEGTGASRLREARVPAVLELLGIPYTGADPFTLCVTLDKDAAKRLVEAAGVAVPRSVLFTAHAEIASPLTDGVVYPSIVKPAWEGSSKGIRGKCIVDNGNELRESLTLLRRDYRQPVLVEQYIEGDELTVGLAGNDPPQLVGVMRVLPLQPTERFVYGLEVKRDWENRVRYECPAALSKGDMTRVQEAARTSFRALGCRDVARIDFRLHEGTPYFLEANPLPGLNPETGDIVIMGRHMGWSHERLVTTILQAAIDRSRKGVS